MVVRKLVKMVVIIFKLQEWKLNIRIQEQSHTASSFGLMNSTACLLMACRAALGAYPGWGGGAGGRGTSDLPDWAICTRRTAISFISWGEERVSDGELTTAQQ